MVRHLAPLLFLLFLTLVGARDGARAEEGADRRRAQPPGGMPAEGELVPTLRAWLRTGTGVDAAWAGWLAGERRIHVLAADVVARLEREATAKKGTPYLEDVLLDALISLQVAVPSRALRHVSGYEAVTVLLCRRPAFEPAHLDVFAALDDDGSVVSKTWLGLGNLLARWRVPEFVAQVLRRYRIERLVRVFDRDPPYDPWRGPSDGVPGDGVGPVPEGMPPIAVWRLSDSGSHGYALLSPGPHPVYARRDVHPPEPDRRIWWGSVSCTKPSTHDMRHAWLRGWLRGIEVPKLEPWATVEVKWTGGRQVWRRLAHGVQADLHDRFRAWRDALHARGLLEASALPGLRPRVELELRDERDLRRWSLPSLPILAFEPRLPRAARPRLPHAGGL